MDVHTIDAIEPAPFFFKGKCIVTIKIEQRMKSQETQDEDPSFAAVKKPETLPLTIWLNIFDVSRKDHIQRPPVTPEHRSSTHLRGGNRLWYYEGLQYTSIDVQIQERVATVFMVGLNFVKKPD